MEKNFTLRNKGLDEIVGVSRGLGKTITSRSGRRMNLPTYPMYNTYEEALLAPGNGHIYAVRVSRPGWMMADLTFPVLYVKVPTKDRSIARKSYNEAIKNHYGEFRLINRRIFHIDYETHITPKLIA